MKKILSLIIAVFFMASATGVYLVKHTCLHSGETAIVLYEKHDCYEQHPGSNTAGDPVLADTMCTDHGDHTNCCENHIVYLKSVSEYQKPGASNAQVKFDLPLPETENHYLAGSAERVPSQWAEPPFLKSSRDIHIRNGILIL